MRDQGKFSKKFEGRHSYFIYLDLIDDNINDDYPSPPPAPRYRKDDNIFLKKYFNKSNVPNKYHINQNK
jgi:hypothetical protein